MFSAKRIQSSGPSNHMTELRSCVKVKVAIMGSLSLISLMVSVDVKQHWTEWSHGFLLILRATPADSDWTSDERLEDHALHTAKMQTSTQWLQYTIFESHSQSLAIRREGNAAPGLFQHLEADQLVVAFVRPDAHTSIIARCGIQGFVGVGCQSPQLSLLVTLQKKEKGRHMKTLHVPELPCVCQRLLLT